MRDQSAWRNYALAVALVAGTTLLSQLAQGAVTLSSLLMFYLAAVVIAALYLGRGPSIVAVLLSVLAFDFFFVRPRFDLSVFDREYLLDFLGLLIVGYVIGSLTSRSREHAQASQAREAQARALYEFNRDLAAAGERAAILQTIVTHAGRTFAREAALWLAEDGETPGLSSAGSACEPDGDVRAAVAWVLEHNEPAGHGAARLPASRFYCVPLATARGVTGVLGVAGAERGQALTGDELRLLEVFASQAALAIERADLAQDARQAQLLQATQRLQSALLHSISHDLRTPLVTITIALSNLETAGDRLDEAARQSLARTGREQAELLNRLVGNLLDMSRLEAGAMTVTKELCDVDEAISVALDRLAPRLDLPRLGISDVDERPVAVESLAELPPVPMDLALVAQALVNVLDNAVKYSPPGTEIAITTRQAGDQVEIAVADRGPGIPPGELPHIFDKFYRVQRTGDTHGSGLGLAISKGIVEAHGGRIWAEARPGGGTIVTIALPLQPAAPAAGS